jgi:hypothetical protein
MVDSNFQRMNAVSNAHVGNDFEAVAARHLAKMNIPVRRSYAIPVGYTDRVKSHRFDLGNDEPPILVECKSHTWTSGGNMPSAKLTVWNEAMYYFALAPTRFRKIFFVLKDLRQAESLAAYYVRLYNHMIPAGTEIWEYCPTGDCVQVIFQT